MSLVAPHNHKLRKYQVRNQKQWNCIVPFCKYWTRNALDLMGFTFECPHCGKFFRFEDEDLKQKTADVQCPECNKESKPERLLDMIELNKAATKTAITEIVNEVAPRSKETEDEIIDIEMAAELIANSLKSEDFK